LEANRPNWILRLSDQYLETIEEAEARGRFELSLRSAVPYTWSLPANPLLRSGSVATVLSSSRIHMQRVTIEPTTADGKIAFVTRAEGLLYVV